MILSGITMTIISFTILQDFWESKRSGYTFHFSESLLFKSVWLVYIPVLTILYRRLKSEMPPGFNKTILFIISSVTAHIFIFSCFAALLSLLFYEGRYDLFKFFSYTLTHDLYTHVLVYTGFVSGYKYLSNRPADVIEKEKSTVSDTLIINNGRNNVIINVEDIIQITSATPYVTIHLDNKKHLYSETLKSMLEQLDENIFVRVHKSALVNLSKVHSFRSRLNGDYDLQMADGTLVRLSRTYAAEFKKRFTTRSSG